jgi:hypothetical protein
VCGSCAAFASTTALEVCYKKLTGRTATFSEQQLLDCGYGFEQARACDGAPIHAYLKWSERRKLSGGSQYPYRARRATCKVPQPVLDQAVGVTSSYYTYSGSETLLATLVAERSAVVIGLWFNAQSFNAFKSYRSGVFNGCTKGGRLVGGHAMAVVGYGTERNQDYWLIKNSWGTAWGEKGYMKLRRGVKACDIGTSIAAIACGRTTLRSAPAPLRQQEPENEAEEEGEEEEDGEDEDDD